MHEKLKTSAGFGCEQAYLKVYIDNRPPLDHYQNMAALVPIQIGEILEIGRLTGNHWRKIFNVYAKLCFELMPENFNTWQNLRDQKLLQKGSDQALIFNQTGFNQYIEQGSKEDIHIIMGRTFASSLIIDNQFSKDLIWLNEEFAINKTFRFIVCPYFDYRQLSNLKISYLVKLITSLKHL